MATCDWFKWNGKSCTDYGLHMTEQPTITIAEERADFQNVSGRNGAIAVTEGTDIYNDITITINGVVKNLDQLVNLAGWLKGSGTLEIANRPGGYYNARATGTMTFDQTTRGKTVHAVTITFRCAPLWYDNENPEISLTDATFITNSCNVVCNPTFKLTGTGTVSMYVGLYSATIEFGDTEDTILIDSELMECYGTDGSNKNSKVTCDDFPVLKIGSNSFMLDTDDGTVSAASVYINPRYR